MVGDGAEAVVKLARMPFDLLITDVAMPNMDGVELSLKVGRDYPNLSVLLMSGYALPPPSDPSLFDMARVGEVIDSHIGNVCDLPSLEAAIQAAKPEIVIHMAAQSLVRYSYDHPVETFTTNVVGTVHLLDAVRRTPSVRSVAPSSATRSRRT